MKSINQILRILVGGLFIFSGLIKLNDPYGTAYKLEEYFEVFSQDFSPFFLHFISISLFISLFICAVEVILGVAILLNYRMKFILWTTLLMIVFFTFLTFYAFYYNKVKECGCFGDFIKLTPKTSFYKDLVLTFMILILFFQRNHLVSKLKGMKADALIVVVTFISFGIGYYAIEHLPFLDFLPYKTGNNIPSEMKAPETPKYKYIMTKEGKTSEFTTYPTDPAYKLDTFELMNPDKIYAKITDYRIWNDEGDYTDSSFTGAKLFVIVQSVEKAKENKSAIKHFTEINNLIKSLDGSDIKAIALTASSGEQFEEFRHEVALAVPFYYTDGVVLKTMIRSNPGIMLLKDGTVKGKWHYNDVPDAETIKSLLK
jgi:uncharacterized membrane protein YphA (DoxX/SURF4 family)